MNLRFLTGLFAIGLSALSLAATEGWMHDLDAAKLKSAKERNPLLIEFTGSTWCPPCKALEAQVLKTPEFAAFSRNVVLVSLDYPALSERTPEKIRANPELARLMAIKEKYDVPGFPTVFLYDADGNQLAKIVGYGGQGSKAYLSQLKLPK